MTDIKLKDFVTIKCLTLDEPVGYRIYIGEVIEINNDSVSVRYLDDDLNFLNMSVLKEHVTIMGALEI